jgi:NhaA family Na+:H+ antiporter
VPVFAFLAAGVSVAGAGGLGAALLDPVAVGIVVGLVVGKPVGVLGATWLVQRFTRARLAEGLSWWDVLGLALLAGIGFTVSLLIGELAFGIGSERDDHVKVAVLLGSLLAALLAGVVLRVRNRRYRRLCAEEEVDADEDGVPDMYQPDRDRG